MLKIWDDKVENLLDAFDEINVGMDDAISKKIYKLIAKLDSVNGKLTPQNIAQALKEIDLIFSDQFKTKKYKTEIEKMHGLIDAIADANVVINSDVNKLDISKQELNVNASLELHTEKIITSLSEAGLKQNVIIPVKQMINSAVVQGKGTGALITEFEALFDNGNNAQLTDIRGRSLSSYSRQIANDATNAANGQIQVYLKDKYQLNKIRYVGSTIRDSRPFCVHMIKDEKYPMEIKTLEKILKEYVGSKEKIQVGKNKDGTPKMRKKGAGMYDLTNTKNFNLVVGGYNCRHRCFVVR